MDNNKLVIESLRKKFEEKANQTFIMDNEDKQNYAQAQAGGNIMQMLAIKTGKLAQEKAQEQFKAELENIDIKLVVKELKDIEPKIKRIESQIETKSESMKVDILKELQTKEQTLFRKGITKGSRLHLILQEETMEKLDEIESNTDILNLKRQLFDTTNRLEQLKHLTDKYKQDNDELINEIKREQVRKNLIELGLID